MKKLLFVLSAICVLSLAGCASNKTENENVINEPTPSVENQVVEPTNEVEDTKVALNLMSLVPENVTEGEYYDLEDVTLANSVYEVKYLKNGLDESINFFKDGEVKEVFFFNSSYEVDEENPNSTNYANIVIEDLYVFKNAYLISVEKNVYHTPSRYFNFYNSDLELIDSFRSDSANIFAINDDKIYFSVSLNPNVPNEESYSVDNWYREDIELSEEDGELLQTILNTTERNAKYAPVSQ